MDDSPHSLQSLLDGLRSYLGHKSGINSADIDVVRLKELLAEYIPKADEWLEYGKPDDSRNYTRLLISDINGQCNLVSLCRISLTSSRLNPLQLFIVWNPARHSPIHDHADAHCVMKILKGTLEETLYNMPAGPSNGMKATDTPLEVQRKTQYTENQVTYVSDDLGIHQIRNPDPNETAVSLHCKSIVRGVVGRLLSMFAVYTPPNAAEYGYNIFDQGTGKSSHVPGRQSC